jgi:OmcA/MtrC family decaheme c-type cytochrome
VTVAFSVTDAGAPVTNPAAFSGLNFTLAKLVPARGDAPSYWQSYLSKARTKVASKPPVVQGRTEAYPTDGGTLTQVGSSNVYLYTFALLNASTPGDLRTIDHVHNNSTVTGAFNQANLPTLRFVVPYEPTRTHRIAMAFNKELGANDIANKWNAHLDFVPAGGTAETRNIVSRTACNKCHGDSKLHAGFDLEYCVGCHNQNSFDPFTGTDPTAVTTVTDTVPFGASSVALERIVHKIHMGKDLANGFVLNGTHDYSKLQYPGGVPSNSSTPSPRDCTVCHDESNVAMTDAARWKSGNRACGSCHDGIVASAHIAANTFDPTPSTSPLGAFGGDEVEACSICHAPGGLAPVDAAHLGAVR